MQFMESSMQIWCQHLEHRSFTVNYGVLFCCCILLALPLLFVNSLSTYLFYKLSFLTRASNLVQSGCFSFHLGAQRVRASFCVPLHFILMVQNYCVINNMDNILLFSYKVPVYINESFELNWISIQSETLTLTVFLFAKFHKSPVIVQ